MRKFTEIQIWLSRELARAWRVNHNRGYRFQSAHEAIQTSLELDKDLAKVWHQLTGTEQIQVEDLLTDTKR